LVKWDDEVTVTVNEYVESSQVIGADLLKLGQKDCYRPKSDKYDKYKPVIKELFLQYYNLAVKCLYEQTMDDGEFYINKRGKYWFEVLYFSKDEKKKSSIQISFSDRIDDFSIGVNTGYGHYGRPRARKEGKAITDEQFKLFLNLTIQYLYDCDSLLVHMDDYIRNFLKLCDGEKKIDSLVLSDRKTIETIISQLEARKEYLERRLIENDNDHVNDRVKLRGELEGIAYAMKVVRTS
jgi:hypothetical protein